MNAVMTAAAVIFRGAHRKGRDGDATLSTSSSRAWPLSDLRNGERSTARSREATAPRSGSCSGRGRYENSRTRHERHGVDPYESANGHHVRLGQATHRLDTSWCISSSRYRRGSVTIDDR